MADKHRSIRGVVKVERRKGRNGNTLPYWYASFKAPVGWIRNRRTDVPSTAPEADAIVDARRLQAEYLDPTVQAERELTLLDAIVLRHQHDTERAARGDIAPATLASYEHIAERLRRDLDQMMLLSDLDRDVIRNWEEMRLSQVSRHTVTKERNYLRAMVRWMAYRGLSSLRVDQLFSKEWKVGYVPRTRWLPEAEVDALLAELSPKRAAHVAHILATGADWGPSTAARPEHYQWQRGKRGVIHVPGTKTATRLREVPILTYTERFAKMAYAYLEEHGSFAEWSSGSKNRDLSAACERAGIAHCSFKDIRRTTGMWVHMHGGHAGLTALFLGHSDTSMVMKTYARLQGEHLGEALEKGDE